MESFSIAPPGGGSRSRKLNDPLLGHCESGAVAAGVRFHHWGLGFRQSSFRLITRALRDGTVSAFGWLPLLWRALFPSGFRLQVNQMTQKLPSEFLLTASGIQYRVPRRTNYRIRLPPRVVAERRPKPLHARATPGTTRRSGSVSGAWPHAARSPWPIPFPLRTPPASCLCSPATQVSGRRRRARLPSRWPPSAAQTERAVFPHSAFTKARYKRRRIEGISAIKRTRPNSPYR